MSMTSAQIEVIKAYEDNVEIESRTRDQPACNECGAFFHEEGK